MENSWKVTTAIILLIFISMFALIGALIGYVFGFLIKELTPWNCALAALVVAAFIAVYCYLCPVDPVIKGMNAQLVDEYSCPRVFNIVKSLSERANTPMPLIYVCDVDYPNAFALGRSPDKSLVAVTKPLLSMLSDDELEGVLGHELSHILHRDTIVNGVARTSASILTTFAVVMGYAALASALALGAMGNSSSRSKNDNGAGIALILMFIVLVPVIIVGAILYVAVPGASAILKFGISRSREYGADESSARLTKKPMALASALLTMEAYCSNTNNTYQTRTTIAAPMMIVNPFGIERKKFRNSMLSTHPSTESRIKRLIELEEEINGTPKSSIVLPNWSP